MEEDEQERIADGATPRDLSQYAAWRDKVDDCILEALYLYGCYLVGQTNGMSDSLNLPAMMIAMDLEEVPEEDRPQLATWLLRIHSNTMTILRNEADKK